MNYKIAPLILLTLLLSSCCWLRHDDCAEYSAIGFPLSVEFDHTDTVLDINDLLPVKVFTSDFQSDYDEIEYNQISLNIQIEWFDGNFSSTSNHKVNMLNSNLSGLSLADYNGYYGPLPANDVEFDLEFTVPGYYLVSFYGNANKYEEPSRRNRCSCGNGLYQEFNFNNLTSNDQYFSLYENSKPYSEDLARLKTIGAYFIKVE